MNPPRIESRPLPRFRLIERVAVKDLPIRLFVLPAPLEKQLRNEEVSGRDDVVAHRFNDRTRQWAPVRRDECMPIFQHRSVHCKAGKRRELDR
jgi:hypothetical protein